MNRASLWVTGSAVLALIGVVNIHAAVFLYENFNYNTGTLAGQSATGLGETPGGIWRRYTDTEDYYNNVASNLTYGMLATANGSLQLSNATAGAFAYYGIDVAPSAYTNWTTTANGQTREIWASFLYRSPSHLSDFTRFGWARSTNEAQMFGFEVTTNLVRAFIGGSGSAVGLPITNSTTYYVVLRLTGFMTGGVRTYTNVLWLFSGDVLPMSESDLALYPSVTNVASGTSANYFDAHWMMWFRTRGTSVSATNFVTFDEIRMGNNFGDVLMLVPEPSATFLFGSGVLLVLAVRRSARRGTENVNAAALPCRK